MSGKVSAQLSIADSAINFAMFQMYYQGFVPSGDMGKRFGYTSTAGATLGYKFKNNVFIRGGFSGLFGGVVKDTVLQSLLIGGYVVDNEGNFVAPRAQESGFVLPLSIGKIFHIQGLSPNSNSGFYAEVGTQVLQHKIRYNVPRNKVPALSKPYQKGYDQMCNGIGITQSIGYILFGNTNYWNVNVGFDFSQNFTQNRRSFNFDLGGPDTRKRLDMLWGFHAGWVFPLYRQAPSKVYYY
jgi:hypothetical protein